ncbi:MAG TPA: cupin domain-containing protein [Candidatus Acidoferrales bacterium]
MKFWDWNHIQAEEVTTSQWKKSLDAENLNVAMVELLEGAQTEARSQQTEQVILVLHGALRVQVRDEEVTLRASQMLSVPPHTRYSAVALKTASFVTVRANSSEAALANSADPIAAGFLDDQGVHYDPDQYLWAV